MGLSHLLVADAGAVPIKQSHREGDHIPRSKNIPHVGLHVLMGQRQLVQ